jgi:Regulator of chromosome condensation (RCC1) repeat
MSDPPEVPRREAPVHARQVSVIMRACAIANDGRLYEQSGDAFDLVDPERRYQGVSCGQMHGCAWTRDGAVTCWGYNEDGRVGIGKRSVAESAKLIPGLSGVTDMAAGARSSCAVHGGRVSCWGDDADLAPKEVPAFRDVVRVTSGTREERCALGADGSVYRFEGRGEPRLLDQLPAMAEISECMGWTCGIRRDGGVSCWEVNGRAHDIGVSQARKIASTHENACALTAGGELRCWALGADEVGKPTTPQVPTLAAGRDIAAAYGEYCVLTPSDVVCFKLDAGVRTKASRTLSLPPLSK